MKKQSSLPCDLEVDRAEQKGAIKGHTHTQSTYVPCSRNKILGLAVWVTLSWRMQKWFLELL